jgi:hypothetical protein
VLASANAEDMVLVFVLLFVGIFLYFLPSYIAHRRDHGHARLVSRSGRPTAAAVVERVAMDG